MALSQRFSYILLSFLFFLLSFLAVLPSASGQEIRHVYGSLCVDTELVFQFIGDTTTISYWSVGGDYTKVQGGGDHGSIIIKRHNASESFFVEVGYVDALSNENKIVSSKYLSVEDYITPSVEIAFPETTICEGSAINFTATPTDGGATPTYYWYVDESQQTGENSSTFSASSLSPGSHEVYVIMRTSKPCATEYTTESNKITVNVTEKTIMEPVVSLDYPSGETVVYGCTATFVVTVEGESTGLTYTWFKGNSVVTSAADAQPDKLALSNYYGEEIRCEVSKDAFCYEQNVSSNTLAIPTSTRPAFSVGIEGVDRWLCKDEETTLTAIANMSGATYTWTDNNGVSSQGSSFTTTATSEEDLNGISVTASVLDPCGDGEQYLTDDNDLGDVEFTVYDPDYPTVVQPHISEYNTSATLTASGALTGESYRWYTDPSEGSPLNSTTTPILTANTTYYVSKYVAAEGCEGPRQPFTVTVNKLPVANAGADKIVILPDDEVTLNGSGTDEDGSISSYAWEKIGNLPASSTNWDTPSITITDLEVGTYVFRLTVTDDLDFGDTDDVTVTVRSPPIVDAGSDKTVVLPDTDVRLRGSVSDPDGEITSITWEKTSGAEVDISSPTTATTNITGLEVGSYVFELSATDNHRYTSSDRVNVFVRSPPIALAGDDQIVVLGDGEVMLEGTGTDDVDSGWIRGYAWSIVTAPDEDADIFDFPESGTTGLSNLQPGTYVLRLTVRDNFNLTAYDDVTIIVRSRPVVNAGTDQTIILPDVSEFTLSGTVSDPDGEIESFGWSLFSGPTPTASIANPTNTTTTVPVTDLLPGTYVFRLTATDDHELSNYDQVSIIVQSRPTVNAGEDQTIYRPNTQATLNGVATDDGEIESYRWEQLSNPKVPINDDDKAKTAITGLDLGIYEFKLTVTDEDGLKASDEVTVTVTYPPNNYNYIRTTSPQVKDIKETDQLNDLSINDKTVGTTYFDGLGRPMQDVAWQASPYKGDIVQPVQYDDFGREARNYLPYVAKKKEGEYYPDAVKTIDNYNSSDQYDFYQDAAKIAHDTHPFAQSQFEASPLNRINEQGAPGSDWQPGSGNTTKIDHKVNQVTDRVINWKYAHSESGFGSLLADGYYPTGQLYLTETVNEDEQLVKEFTDKKGRVLLKEVRGEEDQPNFTYFVYDDFDNLRAVFQPAFMEAWKETGGEVQDPIDYEGYQVVEDDIILDDCPSDMKYYVRRGGSLTLKKSFCSGDFISVVEDEPKPVVLAVLNDFVFFYHYDQRQRLVEKNVPGAGTTYMVYDKWDRLVLIRDEEQKAQGQWVYTKFDQFNRPIITGLWEDPENRSREDLQADVNTFSSRFETRDADHVHGYSFNKAFPKEGIEEEKVLAITYYDDYGFAFLSNDAEDRYQFVPKDGFDPEPIQNPKDWVTGTKIKVLGLTEHKWLQAVNYYDDRYRLIQRILDNQQQDFKGYDRNSHAYNFTNRITLSLHEHEGTTQLSTLKEYQYDHAGRLINNWQTIDGKEENKVLIAQNEYNGLGALVDKKLHAVYGEGNFMQSVDYRYNIRGWLTHINNSSLEVDGFNDEANDFFGLELKYNTGLQTGGGKASYSGNISEALWKNRYDNKLRAFSYQYDKLNRLESATYKAYGVDWSSDAENERYNVTFSYDANGNIKTLNRRGKIGEGQYGDMDILEYHYNGNQLTGVTNSGSKKFGFKGGKATEDDYLYDRIGKLLNDEVKGYSVRYNFLNLPEVIELGGDTTIVNQYDAEARKLSEEVFVKGSSVSKHEYVGGMVYEDGKLSFISHPEGKILPHEEDDGWEYQYHLKDHLDNVRLTFTSEPEKLEYLATMEQEQASFEDSQFDGFGNSRVPVVDELNHTPLQETGLHPEVVRLNAARTYESPNPGISLAVLPGDKVEAKVWAKYLDLRRSELNADALIAALTGTVAGYSVSIEGSGTATIADGAGNAALLGGDEAGSPPKAFLNYYLFDQNFQLIDMGFVGVTEEAAIDPENLSKAHQELITPLIEINQAGILRIELSHDEAEDIDIYFDDLTVTHQLSPVISADDYYPFGLSIEGTAFSRNNPQYKGRVSDASLLPQDFVFRQYDPILGRFTTPDPLGELTLDQSPYHYGFNNPVLYSDPLGLKSKNLIKKLISFVKNALSKRENLKGTSVKVVNRVRRGSKKKRGGKKKSDDGSQDSSRRNTKPKPKGNDNDNDGKNLSEEKKDRYYIPGASPIFGGEIGVNIKSPDFDARQAQRTAVLGWSSGKDMQSARGQSYAFKQPSKGNPTSLGRYHQDFGNEEFGNNSTLDGNLQAYRKHVGGVLGYLQSLFNTTDHEHQTPSKVQASQERNVRGESSVTKTEVLISEVPHEGPGKGFTINYKGVESNMKSYKVTYVKEKNGGRYAVIDVQVTEIENGLTEHEALYKAGAVFMQKKLQENTYSKTEDGTLAGKQMQEELKEHLQNLANKANEVDGVEDLHGASLEEKKKIKEAIGKYTTRYGVSSEVIIADEQSAKKIKQEFDNGTRTPEKDVTVILGKDDEGNTSYSIVRKDGVLQPPSERTFVDRDGEERTIQLDNNLKEVEIAQDQAIAGAAANENLATDWDENRNPVAPNPEQKSLSVYDRVMMGFTFTRDLVNNAQISEPFYNHKNADGTPTGLKEENIFPIDVHPSVAAAGNVMIDEAKSYPDLIIFGGSMLLEEGVMDQVIESITSLGPEKIKAIFKERWDSYDSSDKGWYNVAYDGGTVVISIVAIGSAIKQISGAIKKAGKMKKAMGDVLDGDIIKQIDLPQDKLERFLKDVQAEDAGKLKEAVAKNPQLSQAWNKLDDLGEGGDNAFAQLKKDPDFLKKFDDVVKSDGLNGHIFKGDPKIEDGKIRGVSGVHSKDAINITEGQTSGFSQGDIRYQAGTMNPKNPAPDEFYNSKVEIYGMKGDGKGGWNNGWINKKSTFFPDGWSKAKIQAEVANALKTKQFHRVENGADIYRGTGTDGTIIEIVIRDGVVKSAYPII